MRGIDSARTFPKPRKMRSLHSWQRCRARAMANDRSTALVATAFTATLCLAAINTGSAKAQPASLDIPFGPTVDRSISDPDNPTKVFRVDLARVEEQFPLSRADLMKITPENLS